MFTTELKSQSNGTIHAEIIPVPNHHKEIEHAVGHILANIDGEVSSRQGLMGTPNRVARMYDEILGGYNTDPITLVNGALFDVEYDEMILVKDIEFFSMCEHHMLPFYGRAHVA